MPNLKQFSALLNYLDDNNVKAMYYVRNEKRICIVKTEIKDLTIKFTATNSFEDTYNTEFIHALYDTEACRTLAYKNEYANVHSINGSAITKDAIKNIIIDSFVK